MVIIDGLSTIKDTREIAGIRESVSNYKNRRGLIDISTHIVNKE
uniref:Uncharacterized protein n=1 Tax=Lepeophtheirus salmonis TaxID=72036 RepID=A0A0K2T7U5_LEPSM